MSKSKRNTTAGRECLILAVHTTRQADSQEPPGITMRPGDDQQDEYVGYFENAFGEAWIVVVDRQAETGWLAGHETAWEWLPIDRGRIQADLLLSPEERRWLDACWRAATGEPMRFARESLIEAALLSAGR